MGRRTVSRVASGNIHYTSFGIVIFSFICSYYISFVSCHNVSTFASYLDVNTTTAGKIYFGIEFLDKKRKQTTGIFAT